MSVSVVIATRDRRDSLLETLARLEGLPERPRVVVVDNGSSDGSPRAVRRRYPRVGVVEIGTESGRGLGAAARTLGARLAGTPYIAFSDDDSWWAPGALRRAAELFHSHPRLGLIAARIIVQPDGRVDPTCRRMERSALPRDPQLPGPQVLGFVACGAVVRRSAFLACGGFQRRLDFGGEEMLLAIDMAAAGWRLAYVDDVVAHHQPSDGDRSWRRPLELRNELWTAWLRRPLPRALAITGRLVTGPEPGARAALRSALRGLPWVLRERRVVPPHLERALQLLER